MGNKEKKKMLKLLNEFAFKLEELILNSKNKTEDSVFSCIRYVHSNPGFRGYTATFKCTVNHTNNTLAVTPAICTPDDRFSKEEGRAIVSERNHHFLMRYDNKTPLVDQIMSALYNHYHMDYDKMFIITPKSGLPKNLNKALCTFVDHYNGDI